MTGINDVSNVPVLTTGRVLTFLVDPVTLSLNSTGTFDLHMQLFDLGGSGTGFHSLLVFGSLILLALFRWKRTHQEVWRTGPLKIKSHSPLERKKVKP